MKVAGSRVYEAGIKDAVLALMVPYPRWCHGLYLDVPSKPHAVMGSCFSELAVSRV